MIIRAATEDDLPAILQIQESAPEAAQWAPRDYLAYECLVAENGAAMVAFLVARAAGPESEILNLAVAPGFRRQGIGRQLLSDFRAGIRATSFWKFGNPMRPPAGFTSGWVSL